MVDKKGHDEKAHIGPHTLACFPTIANTISIENGITVHQKGSSL
jgi:hypothetical protein